jgi:hypothetical protein
MQFSGDDLMGIRRQALEHIALDMEQAGAEPRPTPEEVADNLEHNHGRIKYGPHDALIDIDAADQSLANARNPEEVLSRLYRLSRGDPHHFLTGPMTEFINRTSFAHGDDIGSSRSRLPGSVGGAGC